MTLDAGTGGTRPERAPEIERAVSLFGLRMEQAPLPVASSVLNENFRVETNDGPRFVRVVRKTRPIERVMLEWRAMVWAVSRDIPAPLPALVAGAPFVQVGGDLIQLYPWVEGREGWPEPDDAFIAGEMHGRVHGGLAYLADDQLPAGGTGTTWDTEQSIALLSRVDDLIRYYPSPGARQLRIQDGLRYKLELLESDEPRPMSDFAGLGVQPCHGDYHSRNLIFGPDGEVAAVVDWELVGLLPPVFELVRAVSFSGLLEERLLGPYLEGYRQHRRFEPDELRVGVEMWWQSLLHNTWAFRMRFIQGDERVDRFFEADDALTRRFAKRAYREWLADELVRLASAG